MNSLTKYVCIALLLCFLTACSKAGPDKSRPKVTVMHLFPQLPESKSEFVTVTAKVIYWFFEGSAGCYGTLSDGTQKISVHSDADTCENVKVSKGKAIKVDLTFDPEIHESVTEGSNTVYSITRFY